MLTAHCNLMEIQQQKESLSVGEEIVQFGVAGKDSVNTLQTHLKRQAQCSPLVHNSAKVAPNTHSELAVVGTLRSNLSLLSSKTPREGHKQAVPEQSKSQISNDAQGRVMMEVLSTQQPHAIGHCATCHPKKKLKSF